MTKGLMATGMIFCLILGLATGAAAQQNVIDNLKIESIKSVQVREEADNFYLDIKVNITNSNDRLIRLTKGDFIFSIRSEYIGKVTIGELSHKAVEGGSSCNVVVKQEGDEADKEKEIGVADPPFFVAEDCHTDNEEIFLKPGGDGQPNIVMFHVNIGKSHQQASSVLMHIMNCIGYPAIKKPNINIKGKFELGIKSDKGWSMVRDVIIEWIFIPEIQDKVNFMTAEN